MPCFVSFSLRRNKTNVSLFSTTTILLCFLTINFSTNSLNFPFNSIVTHPPQSFVSNFLSFPLIYLKVNCVSPSSSTICSWNTSITTDNSPLSIWGGGETSKYLKPLRPECSRGFVFVSQKHSPLPLVKV